LHAVRAFRTPSKYGYPSTIVYRRTQLAIPFPLPKFNTLSGTVSPAEGRVHRDLLASFVVRAINYGFIGQERADSRRLRGTKEGRPHEGSQRAKEGDVLYRPRRDPRRYRRSFRNHKMTRRIGPPIDFNYPQSHRTGATAIAHNRSSTDNNFARVDISNRYNLQLAVTFSDGTAL